MAQTVAPIATHVHQVGLRCSGDVARACNKALGVSTESNASSETSSSSFEAYPEYVNTTLARQLDLTPLGGVTNAGEYLVIENVSVQVQYNVV